MTTDVNSLIKFIKLTLMIKLLLLLVSCTIYLPNGNKKYEIFQVSSYCAEKLNPERSSLA